MDYQALATIAAVAGIAALPTWAFGRTLGRRIARRRRWLAVPLTAGLMPAIGVTAGIVLFNIDVAAHPGSDWPAMALLGTLNLSAIALLVTIPIAFATVDATRNGD